MIKHFANSPKQIMRYCCIFFGLLFLFFSLNQNLRKPVFHHDSEIWADKAGYYIYLPATFIYNWQSNAMPKGIDSFTGKGFVIDKNSGKVFSKYPPGEALLEMPFFLVAHLIQLSIHKNEATGFTPIYHASRIISGVFWFFFGLWLLVKTALNIGRRVKEVFWLFILLLFGTNVAYFLVWQPAMSHGYSFFALSLLIFLLQHKNADKYVFAIGLTIGFIGSIRSVNMVLIVPFLFYYRLYFLRQFKSISKLFFLFGGILMGILPLIAQIGYLKSIGSKPYAGETFSHAANPWFAEIFFSATNGIAIYTPLVFLLIAILFTGIFRRESHKLAVAIFTTFLLTTWLYASWWVPTMGCYLGHRGFVDFLPLLFFYGAMGLRTHFIFNKYFIAFAVLCILYTSFLAYQYPGCLDDGMGKEVWNWGEYERVLNQ